MNAPLRILVCVKQILDPEAPPSALEVDAAGPRVSARGAPPVMNPYDANALKAALDLGAEGGGADVTVLTVGPAPAPAVTLKARAAGADRVLALRVSDDPAALVDGALTAGRLAALARAAGDFDLVLAGRQAAGTNAGGGGGLPACRRGVPLVTAVVGLRRGEGATVVVERLVAGGTETVACPLPALVTVSSEVGDLPYPSLPALQAARRKPVEILTPADVGLHEECRGLVLTGVASVSHERECEFVDAPDPRSAGAELARRLLSRLRAPTPSDATVRRPVTDVPVP